jgi:uncharacterized OB-fold protein
VTATVTPRSLPATDDLDTKGFWEAAQRKELVVRACSSCGTVLHAPTPYCTACASWDTTWRTVAGTGTVYSWSVVEHQTHPAFPVPFTLVLVQLDDAPARLIGHLAGRPALSAGQAMRVRWDEREDGTIVPDWETV